ncbi:DUF3006 domain-containing protein [Planococcus salinus]|uniref:DUF3006 domain-containing protein n=1 Tax=Planococcus salinus TaxID=1848460 RepID=A0A3M8P5Z4_9BACL|nr:DUF3006 domain-containing protein [Planococcus salinus]RNF39099.1 DUF3006 domain-containing protein [Planococcus salinus]
MKGTLDRIEDDGRAVILLEELQQEIVLPMERLPAGSDVDSWFDITLENDEVTSIVLDETTSAKKTEQANELLQKLKSKNSGSKFKRNKRS